MKDPLERTLQRLAEELRPYRPSVVLTASTPYGGDSWLRIGIESAESVVAARAVATEIVAACERPLGLTVQAPLDGRVMLAAWRKIDYVEGSRLLTEHLMEIADHMPPDAPPDINGFALRLSDHSVTTVFSTRGAITVAQADYARSCALRAEPGDASFIRVHTGEWYSHCSWKYDYVCGLRSYEPLENWSRQAGDVLDRLYDQYDEMPSLYVDWMVMVCVDAIRVALPKFQALPNVTDDFIAFVDQGDVDEHTRLLDLSRTLGFERAAALLPLVHLSGFN